MYGCGETVYSVRTYVRTPTYAVHKHTNPERAIIHFLWFTYVQSVLYSLVVFVIIIMLLIIIY